jgi:hypothetical protein
MSTQFYKFAYRVGFTPWEDADLEGPVADQISAMFDREEKGRQQPYGKALIWVAAPARTLSLWRPGGGRSRASTSSLRRCISHVSAPGTPVWTCWSRSPAQARSRSRHLPYAAQ